MMEDRVWAWAMVAPLFGMALNLVSAVMYFSIGDYKRCIYWLAAATLTACVTL